MWCLRVPVLIHATVANGIYIVVLGRISTRNENLFTCYHHSTSIKRIYEVMTKNLEGFGWWQQEGSPRNLDGKPLCGVLVLRVLLRCVCRKESRRRAWLDVEPPTERKPIFGKVDSLQYWEEGQLWSTIVGEIDAKLFRRIIVGHDRQHCVDY